MKTVIKFIGVFLLILFLNTNASAGWGETLANSPCPPWCQFSYSAACAPACPTCYCDPSCAFNCGDCDIE